MNDLYRYRPLTDTNSKLWNKLRVDGDVTPVRRAPRLQDQPDWPIRWCPEHCCGAVDTFPERNTATGYKERCYRGWEFGEDCTLVVVEVVLIGGSE